jgi:hypothetical protein
MCVRRAREDTSDHCGPLDISDVITAPGQKAEILLSARGSAYPDHFRHGFTLLAAQRVRSAIVCSG